MKVKNKRESRTVIGEYEDELAKVLIHFFTLFVAVERRNPQRTITLKG